MIVVSDSGPLISLMKADLLIILRELYGEVLIPDAVYNELVSNPDYAAEADEIKTSPFIRKVSVSEKKAVDILQRANGLDLGESEAIVYADENNADVLMMEEEAGRRVAKQLGLRVRGSIGILLLAFDKQIISAEDVIDAMGKMRAANRRISDRLYDYHIFPVEMSRMIDSAFEIRNASDYNDKMYFDYAIED